MEFLTFEPIADGAEEGFTEPVYQLLRSSFSLLGVLLCTLFRELNCTFSDLSEEDVESVRRMVLRKLTEELKQRSHLQLEKTAPLTKALCEFLAALNLIILGRSTTAERDGPDVRRTRYDRYVLSVILEGLSRKSKQCSHASVKVCCAENNGPGWDSLPSNIQENILQRVDFLDLFRFKALSKNCRKLIEGDVFRESRGAKSEGSFTAIHHYINKQSWRCSGYDLHSKSWRSLPPVSCLPTPDPEIFMVCGHGGLMCADVSKLPNKGQLVVFNPLTGKAKALPPLLYPRNPVLLHISADSAHKSFKVIVAGSTASSQDWTKPNWNIMEVFDSSTSEWKEFCNIPGPAFGLSKHQTGVSVNGILYFISYLDAGYRHPRGDYVLAWDMENWRYLENWVCRIPFDPDSKSLLQLVENDGKVYLFSESKEDVGIVCHRIDGMEFHDRNPGAAANQWRNVVEVRKTGVQEICMYPHFRRGVADFTCVGFGEGKLCIFNTLNRDGVVYDMVDGMQCEVLEPPPAHQTGDKVFSLNPASFTLHPSFASDP